MVVVHVKSETEEEEFLLQCPCTVSTDELLESAAEIHALQSAIRRLCRHLRESYPDAPCSLLRAISEAEAYTSKCDLVAARLQEQVLYKRSLLAIMLRHHLQIIETEAQNCLGEDVSGNRNAVKENMQLWWAGKHLSSGKKLSDFIGRNEKTKIVVILKTELSCKQ